MKKLPHFTLRELARKLSRLVASETITPTQAAHQFMDFLRDDPSQLQVGYVQLTPDIQAVLVQFSQQS